MKENIDLMKKILLVSGSAYLGWLIFTGLNELIPAISTLSPIIRVLVGLVGIWAFIKLGWKKQV